MVKKIYRLPEVMSLTGLSRSSIYLRISVQEFPKPLKIGRRAVGWSEDSLIAWQAGVMGGSDADS
ncbi:AlpA family phage regulatory protein [Planktomarina temperata]|nr:AlpA family phage regulatory protein [Planktomarina temperata]